MIDTEMEAHGARRLYQRGEGDASDDFDGEFRGWYDHLWNSLAGALGTTVEAPDAVVKGHRYEVELVTEPVEASPLVAEYGARPIEILANRELQNKTGPHPSERSTRHIELAVHEGVTYGAGDPLGILPRNSAALVLVSSFVRSQPSPVVVLGALLFILGSTMVALDVFRGTSRGGAAGKVTPDDPTR
jgi:cytochrome P450 / NADPH-cytochrome P450 reductase